LADGFCVVLGAVSVCTLTTCGILVVTITGGCSGGARSDGLLSAIFSPSTSFHKRIRSFSVSAMTLFSSANDIIIKVDTVFGPDQRHLQLRTDQALRRNLLTRAKAVDRARQYLKEAHWGEIETPILFKSTPEGAREFLVPTRQKGLAYALPQSPQQYKQILMASGFSQYFQFARCFRDEDLRADRQPEFTQVSSYTA
jgi:aspartyl-tRNA synthetase